MGRVERGRVLTRGGGHVGDDVYVTGTLGDSAAGIALINERVEAAAGSAIAALKERFYRPVPRVAAGRALGARAHAAIDISDGLLADLGHICERSGCGAIVETESVPLSAELLSTFPPQAALAHALGGGDDYELCFTAPPSRADEIEAALDAAGTPLRRIGQLVAGQTVVCRRDGEPYAPTVRGFRHF
jgi:thiamine-monophosphate kinase